jgi:hypothetical protein
MKELLEKRVSEARATSTKRARRVSMEAFIGILSGLLAEIEQHFERHLRPCTLLDCFL